VTSLNINVFLRHKNSEHSITDAWK